MENDFNLRKNENDKKHRSKKTYKKTTVVLLAAVIASGTFMTAFAANTGQTSIEDSMPEVEESSAAETSQMQDKVDETADTGAANTEGDISERANSDHTENTLENEDTEIAGELTDKEPADVISSDEDISAGETTAASEEIIDEEVAALADGDETTSAWLSGYEYEIQNDRIKLNGYIGDSSTVNMPLDIVVPGSAVVNGTEYNSVEISPGLWEYAGTLQFESGVVFPDNSSRLFADMICLRSIDLNNVDTSNVMNMSNMFSGCVRLTGVDLSSLETDNVITMKGMFMGCIKLSSIDISSLDTSNLLDMSDMFRGCYKLTDFTLDGLDLSNVTDMSGLFYGCTALEYINFSNIDSLGVADMSSLFRNCSNLENLDLSNVNTSNATDMSDMFNGCERLKTLNLSGFDTGNVTDMRRMFSNCGQLTSLDVSGFDTGNVTDMEEMFYNCGQLTSLDVSGFDTGNVTDMSSMFSACGNLSGLDVSGFDTENVTEMNSMFSCCGSLKSLDLSGFDTANVTNMSAMFDNCGSLIDLDVKNYNTSNVTTMAYMFNNCRSITNLDLGSFDTSNVTDMSFMFSYCVNLEDLDLKNFETPADRFTYTFVNHMFSNCTRLESLDIRNLANIQYYWNWYGCMLEGCNSLTDIIAPANLNIGIGLPGLYAGMNGERYLYLPKDLSSYMYLVRVSTASGNPSPSGNPSASANPGHIPEPVPEDIVLAINAGPESVEVPAGTLVAFYVDAKGKGLEYQWQYQGTSSAKWNNFINSTNASIEKTVARNWNGWKVRCVVTDAKGNVAISNTATITVYDLISITEQPISVSVPVGEKVAFNIAAESSGNKALTYQWQYQGTFSTKWNNFVNATNSGITKTVAQNWNGWKVRCIIKDEDGNMKASDTAVITIKDPISITEQPLSVTASAGAVISFRITAESSLNEELSYQWQYQGVSSTKWTNFANATSAVLNKTASSSWNGWKVRCLITDESGNRVASDTAIITITASDEPIVITNQPISVMTQANSSVSFNVTAISNNSESLSYQWQYQGVSSTKWTNFANATSSSMTKTPSASWNGWKVRCLITDESGNRVSSNTVTITVQ